MYKQFLINLQHFKVLFFVTIPIICFNTSIETVIRNGFYVKMPAHINIFCYSTAPPPVGRVDHRGESRTQADLWFGCSPRLSTNPQGIHECSPCCLWFGLVSWFFTSLFINCNWNCLIIVLLYFEEIYELN